MRRDARTDRRARQLALTIGAGRVAMGVGILFATRPALRRMGFGTTDASGEALAKLGGGRDIALGAMTLAARDDRRALRTAILVSGACDAADALALGISAGRPETRQAGIGGVIAGGGAAAACLWAWHRLG
ncbi:MAG TPA: DUF4267 domain-containing protein [Solirubrobacterales bacterium]|nr:DUF4267 domain-containing protein [Solirubrobacterales bacterium]